MFKRQLKLSDTEIVEGLQRHDRAAETAFFKEMQHYFDLHFTLIFFDPASKAEIFQSAMVKLWTEIENKKITVIDGRLCRQQVDGQYKVMTASLTTFFITFAKNEHRELMRQPKEDNFDDVFSLDGTLVDDNSWSEKEEQIRIVDECIQLMSPRCIEIITLFYYGHKSLDEIMLIRGDKSTSKDGLKTAKNKCMNTLRQRASERLKSCTSLC